MGIPPIAFRGHRRHVAASFTGAPRVLASGPARSREIQSTMHSNGAPREQIRSVTLSLRIAHSRETDTADRDQERASRGNAFDNASSRGAARKLLHTPPSLSKPKMALKTWRKHGSPQK